MRGLPSIISLFCNELNKFNNTRARMLDSIYYIPDKKRNAPLTTVQLSGKSQVIGQFSLYQCKGMLVTAASHVFCNQASKLC